MFRLRERIHDEQNERTYNQFSFSFEFTVSDLDQTVVILSFTKGGAMDIGAKPAKAGENAGIECSLKWIETDKEMLCGR